MMIGVGTDIVETARIRRALRRESFLTRAFTEEERRQSGGRSSFLAGCFAAKEAVSKCFGTGFSGFGPLDVEVLRDGRGKPFARLHRGAAEKYAELGADSLEISISDTGSLALAFAVLEGRRQEDRDAAAGGAG